MKITLRALKKFMDIETGQEREKDSIITTKDKQRAINGVKNGVFSLVKAECEKPKKENKIIIFQRMLFIIGGIETADYNLAKTFRDRNTTFVFHSADIEQALRLAQYCDVIMDDYKLSYKCDVLILENFDCYDLIIDRVEARKVYQYIHADWNGLKQFPGWSTFDWQPGKKVDKVLSVSETSQKSLRTAFSKPIDSVVVPNILAEPDKKDFLVFITLSRLTSEKGINLMPKMFEAFKKANKRFLWIFCTTRPASGQQCGNLLGYKEAIFIDPSCHNSQLIRNADYLVQLSHNESYCYSVHEALQAGVPVLGTNIPEIARVVKDGKNGYLFDQSLSNLDVEKIFTKIPKFKPVKEEVDKIWEEVLAGSI